MKKYFEEILASRASLLFCEIEKYDYPWEILPYLKDLIKSLGESLEKTGKYKKIGEDVWAADSAVIAKSAEIHGPCVIGEGSEIRHCAYIRGSVLVGDGCVVGNSTELKNCVLFDKTAVPHYNYVGDSILGYKSHLGAGSVISNLKTDETNVFATVDGIRMDTGRRKFGAVLGDGANAGCGCVINPGSIVGKGSRIYPQSVVRGEVPSESIYKSRDNIVPIQSEVK